MARSRKLFAPPALVGPHREIRAVMREPGIELYCFSMFRRRLFASSLRRRLWLVPLAGGCGLLLLSRHRLLPPPAVPPPQPALIAPFSRTHSSILSRAAQTLRDRVWTPILIAKRFIYILTLFFPVFLTSPILFISKNDRWLNLWYHLLVRQMEAAGPSFVKVSSHTCLIPTSSQLSQLGQWAATRKDLFPASLCETLASLQSHSKPHPLCHTKQVIEQVFQRPFEDVFEDFDEVPIGTGAVAQARTLTQPLHLMLDTDA